MSNAGETKSRIPTKVRLYSPGTIVFLRPGCPASFHKTRGGTYTKRIKYYVPGTAWIPNYKLSL
jgi:hypothetical protein